MGACVRRRSGPEPMWLTSRQALGPLGGEDSNPQRLDQNQLCYRLHHPRTRRDETLAAPPAPPKSQIRSLLEAGGFTDVATPCVTSPAGCEGALFFDGVHPTTAGHRLLADRFLAAIAVPEPPMSTLLLAALAGVLLRRRP